MIVDHRAFGEESASCYPVSTLGVLEAHLERNASTLSPDAVVLVTSSELFPFTCSAVRNFVFAVRRLFPGATWRVLSQACVGFHAALLDAATGPAQRSLALLIEAPVDVHQHCLDAIGAGEGGDGLRVREGCGYLLSEKRAPEAICAEDTVVHATWILRQQPGLMGATSLARGVARKLRDLHGVSRQRMVSFQVHSRWCRELMAGMRFWQEREGDRVELLPSIEDRLEHFSSLKPLLELERYERLLEEGPLTFTTIGAGGRIGLSLLAQGGKPPGQTMPEGREVNYRTFPLGDGLDRVRTIRGAFERDGDLAAFHKAIRQQLEYMARATIPRNNEMYVWPMDGSFADESTIALASAEVGYQKGESA